MRNILTTTIVAAVLGLAGAAHATPVSFTLLPGSAGGNPALTGVYRADLSGLGLGQIASVTISDNSAGLGGSPGQFSGFDLDAIVLSTVLINDASEVGTLTPAGTFNFAASLLTPGAQRAPADPALFGTSAGQVDNAVATLELFDGDAIAAIPGAFGFVSLGDNGILSVNLLSAVALGGPLYLYIGEVGNNGEVAASNIVVSDVPVETPEPAAGLLFAMGALTLAGLRWSRLVGQFGG